MTERTVLVRLRADPSAFNRGMMEAAAGVNALRKEINTTNERTAWLTQGILAIAPAVVPLGAAAIPVFTGLATEMTVGAAAAGVLALGMAGIGDSLKALNTYQLDPTEAHLKALNVSMSKLSSEGQDFVRFLDSLGGIGSSLQNTAQAGMFPGITSGLQDIITLAPQVRRIVREIAEGIGQLADEAGGELAGPKFREFFDWLEADAKPILIEMGHTIGHFAAGLTNLFVAFLPESESFIHGFERMSESFEKWTAGLEGSKGFENFLAYLDESGPQALDFIGALANALIAVIRAAAPVGSLLLPAFTQLLNIFAELVDTPIGSTFIAIAAAMSIYGRSAAIASNLTTGGMVKGFGMANTEALKTTASVRSLASNVTVLGRNMLTAGAATERMAAQNRVAAAGLRTWAGGAARVGGQAALMGVVMSGVADKVHLGNTAMLAMAGSMAGPWGAAIGAGAGLLLDFASASGETVVAADDLRATLDEQTGAITKNTAAYVGNQFQQNGVYEAAKALGLNLNLVTQAALGNHAAITQLTPALAELASQQQTVSGGPHGGSGQVATETANQAQKVIDAISETGKVTKEQAAQIRELMGATRGAASATDTFADRQRKLRAALRDARNAARGSVDMWDALGESVDDSEVSLKQWITQMQRTADALVNFGRNAERAANRGLDQGLIKSLEALGPAGALRMKQLANASESELARANKAWRSFEQAGESAMNSITRATSRHIVINLDTAAALAKLGAFQYQIDQLHGKTVILRTTGGHVPGTPYATGGYTGPGSKYEPRGIVHANELVLPSEVVNADWKFLKARYGWLPGFSEGGLVGMGVPAQGGYRSAPNVNLTVSEIPVRGRVDIDTGSFVGMATMVARSEIDADRDYDEKRANQ